MTDLFDREPSRKLPIGFQRAAPRRSRMLMGPDLLDKVESVLPAHRERLFPPTETLSMFLSQTRRSGSPSQKAVNDVAVKRLTTGMALCSTHTGAYCKARGQLPLEMVRTLVEHSVKQADDQHGRQASGQG